MSLFGFGKKKEEKGKCCCCGCAGKAQEKAGVTGKICSVKVLGAGCRSCHELYENVQAAVRAMGLGLEVEYVTDMEKIMGYGVMSMPAVVVNEKVVSAGRVLKAAEAEKLFRGLEA